MSQTELLDSVRKGIEAAQNVAASRLTGIEDDARKVVSELVEKGRHGQRNLSQRLQRLAENEALRNRVRPVEDALKKLPLNELRAVVEKAVEDLGRRVGELQHTTRGFVEGASREQLLLVVRELRRVADLLANFVADQQDDEKAEEKKSEAKKATSKKPAAKKAAAQEASKAKPAAKKAASKPAAKKASKSASAKPSDAKSSGAKSADAKPAAAKKAATSKAASKPAAKKTSTSKAAPAKAEKASPASKAAPAEASAAATDAAKA